MAEPTAVRAQATDMVSHFLARLAASRAQPTPFRHWLLTEALPRDTARAILSLPVKPPRIGTTVGYARTHEERFCFTADRRRAIAVCGQLADALQDSRTVRALERLSGAKLHGGYLRVEYCQDTDGYWLAPHNDTIWPKLFTMVITLATNPGHETLGTDLYDVNKEHARTVPSNFNDGFFFFPAADTWHGFRKRTIAGVRQCVIVNYVRDDWARFSDVTPDRELAFPDRPVSTAAA